MKDDFLLISLSESDDFFSSDNLVEGNGIIFMLTFDSIEFLLISEFIFSNSVETFPLF